MKTRKRDKTGLIILGLAALGTVIIVAVFLTRSAAATTITAPTTTPISTAQPATSPLPTISAPSNYAGQIGRF